MQNVGVVNDHVHGVLPRHRLPHHGPDSLKIAIRQNDHQSAVHDFGDQILGGLNGATDIG
jgi:hypothetical protein